MESLFAGLLIEIKFEILLNRLSSDTRKHHLSS